MMKQRNRLGAIRRRRDDLLTELERGGHGSALAALRTDLAEVERELAAERERIMREVAFGSAA